MSRTPCIIDHGPCSLYIWYCSITLAQMLNPFGESLLKFTAYR